MAANLGFGQVASLIGLNYLGNFTGAGLGQFFSGRKMYRQYKYQRALQEQAAQLNYNYQLDSARNLPGAQRQGLESAGYNPLLALGNFNATNGYTSAGSAGIATDPNIDMSGDAVNAYKVGKLERDMNKKQQEQIDSIIKNNDANTANAYEQAKTEEMKRQHYQSQIDLNSIQQQLGRKDLNWRDRLYLKDIETAYTNAAANRLGAQAAMSNASTAQNVYELDKRLHGGDIAKQDALKEYYNSKFGHGAVKFGEGASDLTRGLGTIVGLGAGAYGAGRYLRYLNKQPIGFR